jgi:hypothetical protein
LAAANSACQLRGDFHLVRFEASVGLRDAGGQSIQVLLLLPVPGSRTAGRHDSEYDRNRN